MSHHKLVEHTRYVADAVRTDAYSRALQQVVTADSVVLDLGAGTGILGLLAAQAGARQVYAVEEGPIASIAAQIIESSGYADTIRVIGGSSLTVDLPEQVDVVVCDQLFGAVIEADMPRLLADARERHLRPRGVMLPGSYSVMACPVEAPFIRRRLETLRSNPAGLDFTALADATINTAAIHSESDTQPLATRSEMFSSIPTDALDSITAEAEFSMRAGVLDGVEIAWSALLAEGVQITNVGAGAIDRAVATLPSTEPLHCEDGDTIGVRLSLRPAMRQIDWCISHNGHQGQRQSTFFGSLLRNRDLTRASTNPHAGSALETIAAMIKAGEHVTAIEARVWEEHAVEFPSRETAARYVVEALELGRHIQTP